MTRWEMENRRKIDGKSGENLWQAVLLSGIRIIFGLCVLILNCSNNRKYVLGEDWLCSRKKMAPVLGNKLVRFWGKIRHRLWGKPSPILGKMNHRLWENEPPTLGK